MSDQNEHSEQLPVGRITALPQDESNWYGETFDNATYTRVYADPPGLNRIQIEEVRAIIREEIAKALKEIFDRSGIK